MDVVYKAQGFPMTGTVVTVKGTTVMDAAPRSYNLPARAEFSGRDKDGKALYDIWTRGGKPELIIRDRHLGEFYEDLSTANVGAGRIV